MMTLCIMKCLVAAVLATSLDASSHCRTETGQEATLKLNVSQLYYTHGDDPQIQLFFKRQPFTMVKTFLDLVIGSEKVPGVIPRLARRDITWENVTSENIADEIEGVIRELNFPTLQCVWSESDSRWYSDNNRRLFVFQMIQRLFNLDFEISVGEEKEMSSQHVHSNTSNIEDIEVLETNYRIRRCKTCLTGSCLKAWLRAWDMTCDQITDDLLPKVVEELADMMQHETSKKKPKKCEHCDEIGRRTRRTFYQDCDPLFTEEDSERVVAEAQPYFQNRTDGENRFMTGKKGRTVRAWILRVADPKTLRDNIISHDSSLKAEVAEFFAPFLDE